MHGDRIEPLKGAADQARKICSVDRSPSHGGYSAARRHGSQARGRLAEIEAELQELLRSDLYQLKTRVDEAQQGGRDVLKEMIDKVDDQIAQAKRRLDAVLVQSR